MNKANAGGGTALHVASHEGHADMVRLLLARPDVDVNQTTADVMSALALASLRGHGAIKRLLVAHCANEQMQRLAADTIDSLDADLLRDLPDVAAQAAALRLPLFVAAALGDTEDERAAADVAASQSVKTRISLPPPRGLR